MKTYIDPKVELVDHTDFNYSYKAWLESRKEVVSYPEGGGIKVGNEFFDKEYDYHQRVLKMGLQYNDLPTFTFRIKGSALFRDIVFNINKLGQWAVSNRFKFSIMDKFDESSYEISSEYKDIPEWEEQFSRYMEAINNDKVTDNNRLQMPYSITSDFWFSINFNSLIALLTFLKIKTPFFFEVYGKLIVNEFNNKINIDLNNYILDEVPSSITQYIYKNKTDWTEDYKVIDDIVHLKINMGLLLYSQFIRQKDTIIKGLFDEVIHDDIDIFKHKVFYSGTELKVTYTADIDKFMRTVRNRSCNFAMSSGNGINSWSRILDIVIKDMSVDDFMKILPCKFNKLPELEYCPFYDDVKFRDEGVEKRNQICPILKNSLELADEKIKRDEGNKLSLLYKEVVKKTQY